MAGPDIRSPHLEWGVFHVEQSARQVRRMTASRVTVRCRRLLLACPLWPRILPGMSLARLLAAGVRSHLRSPAMWVAAILGAFVSIAALTFDVLALEPTPGRVAGVLLGAIDLVAAILCVWLTASGTGSDLESDWTPAVMCLKPGPSALLASRILVSPLVALLSQVPTWVLVYMLYAQSTSTVGHYLLSATIVGLPTLLLGLVALSAWTALSALWLGPVPALFVGVLVYALPRVFGPHAALGVLPLPTSLSASAPVLARQALCALGPALLSLAARGRLASAGR